MPQNCRKKKQHKKKQSDNNNNNNNNSNNNNNGSNLSSNGQVSSNSTEGAAATDDAEESFYPNNNNHENIKNPSSSMVKKQYDNGNGGLERNLPYDIKISDIMGRYLVASRTLKAGEAVIEETPLAIGPCADNEPVCLGCYQPVEFSITQYKCPQCKWPMCGSKCPGLKKQNGHSTWECAALRDRGIYDLLQKCDLKEMKLYYELILPFRCLLMKTQLKEKWKKLLEMEAHNDIRRKIPSLWNRNQEVIVKRLKTFWGMKDFTDDEIHTICGIIEVNCFEIGQNFAKARALYPSAFLLSHDCCANTTHADHPKNYAMTIRVSRPLKKGDPITLSYAYTFQGTLKRREHLQEGKFFWCQCARCSDPTELGTYSSALRCPKCQSGIILATEPLNNKAPWKCKNCDYIVNATSMFMLLEKMFKDLDSIDPHDIPGLEEFLERYRNVLTKNHYLNISAKYTLCQLYGRIDGYLINQLPEDLLKRKEEYCRNLLEVVDILEPGMTRLRGVIMYELHAPIMLLASKFFETKRISSNELRKRLKEVIKLLKESQEILCLEPEGSNEHTMALAAKDALKRIGPV